MNTQSSVAPRSAQAHRSGSVSGGAADGRSAVAFEGVSRSFGSIRALDGVDLAIPVGSTLALLGPNGAGKSTAISLMLGLLRPDRGTVRTLGLEPRDAVRSGWVGAMLQAGGLPTRRG